MLSSYSYTIKKNENTALQPENISYNIFLIFLVVIQIRKTVNTQLLIKAYINKQISGRCQFKI